METVKAWWFASGDTLPHGDGRRIVLGEAHSVEGGIILCRNGLHASIHPFDALKYAVGPYLYRVECSGDIVQDHEKLACRTRRYLRMIDATHLLWAFARQRALEVIHLWDAPEIVRQYLETGDESISAAASAAARAAAWAAARDARDAAWAAARDAAWAATRDAAWAAARDAASAAARDAAWAAWDAARDAASAAARDAARFQFNEMVEAAFKEKINDPA